MTSFLLKRTGAPSASELLLFSMGVALMTWVGVQSTVGVTVVLSFIIAACYLLAGLRYPELNVILYYIAGKLGFEERLALGWGVSANQILQILFFVSFLLSLRSVRSNASFPRVTVVFLMFWTVVMAIALLYSPNPGYGSAKLLSNLLLILPCVLWVGARTHTHALVQRFVTFFLFISIAMMLMGLKSLGQLESGHRLAVFGGGANVYSRMLGTGLLLLVTMVLVLKHSGYRPLAWCLGLLAPGFLVAMYYAGSKGPLLSMFLCFLAFALMNGFLRRTLMTVAVVVCLFVMGRSQNATIDNSIELISASRMFLNPTDEVSYGSYGSRMEFYTYSAGLVAKSPVFGVGTGAWGTQRRVVEERSYPHNLFVETLTEYGIVMFLMLCLYIVWIIGRALWLVQQPMPPPERALVTGLVACLAFWLFNVQVSGDVIDNRNLWLFAVLVELSARMVQRGTVTRMPEGSVLSPSNSG